MFRLSLRFLVPLFVVLCALIYAALPVVDRLSLKWSQRDLDIRSRLIASTIGEALVDRLREGSTEGMERLFDRAIQDERLFALGFCAANGTLLARTATLPAEIDCSELIRSPRAEGHLLELENASYHVARVPMERGHLVLVHDVSYVRHRSNDTKRYLFYLFLVASGLIALVTVIVAQLSWRGWVSGIRAILKGEGIIRAGEGLPVPELRPILKDLKALVRDLETDRRVQDYTRVTWTPRALKELLQRDLAGDEVLIVSNRQPYIHVHRDGKIEAQVPASGLVTALEPIMRACSGTWIAHGSGSADREVVDANDRVAVPPEAPAYRIRRVWLTPQEEEGYYYGFANEGLWPLCHIAHQRPIFRSADWHAYREVNEKFAKAVVSEAKTEDPVILVQDYHFALLPKLIRDSLPRATVVTFWHIPWPNPEAFGICPWREEILEGMLGSSVMAFHTRYHCNNFLDTVDRYLECRIDRDTSNLSYGGRLCAVRAYPISIEWPPRWVGESPSPTECRRRVGERLSIPPDHAIGLGIDRMDYTKGILERFMAVERFLELHPDWIGRFHFVQIAAPSRSRIERYQIFGQEVKTFVDRINQRFGRGGYQLIRLLAEHHGPAEVYEYLRAADFCFVSSLHDGMNLVAKEFIAARDDERGVLILSMFTGASRELLEALIVNPYHIDQCAEAIHAALEMSPEEQRERMRSLRALVQEYNIFRWAGRMLSDAAAIRQRSRILERVGSWQIAESGRPIP